LVYVEDQTKFWTHIKDQTECLSSLKNLCKLGVRLEFGPRTKYDLFYQVIQFMNSEFHTKLPLLCSPFVSDSQLLLPCCSYDYSDVDAYSVFLQTNSRRL